MQAVLLAAVNSGNRKTWQILLPTFRFGSNISGSVRPAVVLKLYQEFLGVGLPDTVDLKCTLCQGQNKKWIPQNLDRYQKGQQAG